MANQLSTIANPSMYDRLAATARKHLETCKTKTPGSNDPDPEAVKSMLDASARIAFGHAFFVSTMPNLQGEKTRDGFVEHLCGMASRMQTYSLEIVNTCVDVEKRTVILRVEFHMVPKGGEEVLNDIVFWMTMNETGDKILRYTEFVDAAAGAELAKRMAAHLFYDGAAKE